MKRKKLVLTDLNHHVATHTLGIAGLEDTAGCVTFSRLFANMPIVCWVWLNVCGVCLKWLVTWDLSMYI